MQRLKQCCVCQKYFMGGERPRRFCSSSCYSKHWKAKNRLKYNARRREEYAAARADRGYVPHRRTLGTLADRA